METLHTMVYGTAIHAAVAALDNGQACGNWKFFCDMFDLGRVRTETVGTQPRHAEGLWSSLRNRGISGVRAFYKRRVEMLVPSVRNPRDDRGSI